MSENQANEHSEEIRDRFDGNVEAPQDLATNSTSNSLSRRSFLGRAGTSTAVAAASVGFPALLLTEKVEARGVTRIADQDDEEDDSSRRGRSFRIRLKAAIAERKVPVPPQINNGDEALYPNFIGNLFPGSAPQQHWRS